MAAPKKLKGVILLSKEKLDVYIQTMPAVLSLPFPPNIIRSMEVIDKAALTTHVHNFIVTNKLLPSTFSLVIHESLLFEKLLAITPKELLKAPVPGNPAQIAPNTPVAPTPAVT